MYRQKGMDAMRKTAITFGLLILSASTSVGCKSAPKLAWWKSDKTDETALAHAAPELPSDAAKKAEAGSVTQVAGGSAPAFKTDSSTAAAKTSGGYPSTDAPPFTPSAVSQVASTAAASGAAGPYDPAATPAPKAPAAAVAGTGTDRYGLGSLASNAGAAGSSTTTSYGQPAGQASSTPSSYASTPAGVGVPPNYGMPPVSGGDAVAQTAPPYSPAPVTPASNTSTVSTQPYRPGGTSSYNVSVASLPPSSTPSPSAAPAGGAATTPTTPVAPSTTAPPATGANRYW